MLEGIEVIDALHFGMMEKVFVVEHLHVLPGEQEDLKFIGVYRSAESARHAVERLRLQPGFCDHPGIVDPTLDDEEPGFYITEYALDQDHWTEGYVTVFD